MHYLFLLHERYGFSVCPVVKLLVDGPCVYVIRPKEHLTDLGNIWQRATEYHYLRVKVRLNSYCKIRKTPSHG